jgi:hypothetical protein
LTILQLIRVCFILRQSGQGFGSNVQQTGNVLRILNAKPENNGVYVCQATNNAGTDQAATVIEVEGNYSINFIKA